MKARFGSVALLKLVAALSVATVAAAPAAAQVKGGQTCAVKAKVSPESQSVYENTVVGLNGTPSQDESTYLWAQVSGPSVTLSGTTDAKPTFTAPQVGPEGTTLTFLLTVTGCSPLQTNNATATVTVANVNQRPTAAVTVVPSTVFEGMFVTLDGAGSTDPDSDVLTYSWSQTSGTAITLATSGSSASFAAPSVGMAGEQLTFRLRVTDPLGLYNETDVIINVQNLNEPPAVTLSCPTGSIGEGTAVSLIGNASDNDDGIASYSWTQTDGAPGVTSESWFAASLGFDAPSLSGGLAGLLTFRLVVTDNGGLSADATCQVQIADITSPVLSLPENITREATSAAGATVAFTATAEDAHDGSVEVVCAPASDSEFALGSNEVACSAVDAEGNKATGSFTVTVVDTTPPALTLPAETSCEATGPSGAAVTFAASASDLVDGLVSVTCSPASGSTFALGDTTVNCSASDKAGNNASGSFTVRVVDTTPPTLTLPASITQEATGPSGAAVAFTATANDLVDGTVSVTCAPASGSTFSLGTTTVNCNAVDKAGNNASGSFKLSVVDTTPPVLTLPANMSREATGPSGAAVTFTTSANDLVDGSVAATCDPTTGSAFPLGTTTVNCNAADKTGNTATGSFTVTVVDTTPPALSLPGNITAVATGPTGAEVTFAATATDVVDGVVPVTCSRTSGSSFPFGLTAVTCSATDKARNTASGAFAVSVTFAPPGQCLAGPGHQVLQPIDLTGASVFARKAGSTVPTKFRVCDANGNSLTGVYPVSSFQLVEIRTGLSATTPNEDVVPTSADAAFRWSAADQFWIFNLSTRSYAAGSTYVFRINLIDGTFIQFQFGLK